MPDYTLPIAAVIAHRGAAAHAPENTLASFERAKALGAKMVEFDVMLSLDGVPVVIHDMSLERTTNGRGDVSGFTFEELSQFDAGSWFHESFRGQRIPSLKDVLIALREWNIYPNIEIKPAPGMEYATVDAVLECVDAYWPVDQAKPLCSSFSLVVLENLHQSTIGCPIGMLIDHWESTWIEMARRFAVYSVHANVRALTAERVADIKHHGFKALAYTINDPEIAETVFSWGIDGIFSDCPESMLTYLNS